MGQDIHYEIFVRLGARGDWLLHDIEPGRDDAIARAQSLIADCRATGAKVVKETYHADTGEFLTLKIFEDGPEQAKAKAMDEAPSALPCFTPDDLYSYHARKTIARLLGPYLARNRLTLTELMHRGDALEQLEATGTLLQHAIQKIAVARAASGTMSVQQIVKALNDLVEKTIHRVYRDQRGGAFSSGADFTPLAAQLAATPNGLYLLNGALAEHLRDAVGWDAKLERLLTLMEQARGSGRTLLLAAIDRIVAEMLGGAATLQDLLGGDGTFAASVARLVDLFLGETSDGVSASFSTLAAQFAADALPEARIAAGERLLRELNSTQRFDAASLDAEFVHQRRVGDRLANGVGKYLSHEDLIAAFATRSRRLIGQETLSGHLADAADPDEKLLRLLAVEQNIVGAENKRRLAEFLRPVLASAEFDLHFSTARTPVLSRLSRLAELQRTILRSQFDDRRVMADHLDRLAGQIEAKTKLFDTLLANARNAGERALLLLRLSTNGALTEGRMSERARTLILQQLAKPDFLDGYRAYLGKDRDSAMGTLAATLGKAGINAEAGLRAVAP